ncbi:MAG: 3-methyl-2-oxobutanoate dehydrogenase subunit VorB [Spirochaetaceae bacterium]|jgi:2-oxoglutarate ferredoxin oxidoreductase subunit alpha|nr:3-methyl-2-oxobutanoate dehydrogenase subunit VorB [Spirochaetaceae bacterium]
MEEKILMKGNDAMAEAAIIAGCSHYFGYPITPQNEVPAYFAKRLPQVGGTFLQAESELAAISMVMGASAGGARVMTSTSSPGMSLKQEGISYMAGAKLPCVIANIMRGGPGLGGIAGSQADYFQATRGGGNGDYQTIVLAPGNVQELADLTILAFDLADKYRIPVIILGDGYLGQMSEPLVLPKPSGKTFEKPWAITGAKDRDPQFIASMRLTPENALEQLNLELQETYRVIRENEVITECYQCDDADTVLVAYGTAARIANKAVIKLREQGINAGLLRPKTLWPFPSEILRKITNDKKKVLTVEMSAGQMHEDVLLACDDKNKVDFYGRLGGALPKVDEIIERVKSYE